MAPHAFDPPNRDGLPDRRTFLVAGVLFVLTAVPTAVGMAAGSAFLTTASPLGHRPPGPARSPDGPLVIDRRADPAAAAGAPLPGITTVEPPPAGSTADSGSGGSGSVGGTAGGSGTPMARSRGTRSRGGLASRSESDSHAGSPRPVAPPRTLPSTVQPPAPPPSHARPTHRGRSCHPTRTGESDTRHAEPERRTHRAHEGHRSERMRADDERG